MTDPDPAMVVKTLRRAAELVETGWCQGAYGRRDGRMLKQCDSRLRLADAVCAQGAIHVAAELELDAGVRACNLAATEVEATLRLPWESSLPLWQDQPGRTADEVAAALRATADRLEAAR